VQQQPVLRLYCLRHSKTPYSNIFPDLTDEGKAMAESVASQDVLHWMRRHGINGRGDLAMYSSPSPRALGTAHVIKEVIGHPHDVLLERDIEPLRWYDPIECKKVMMSLAGTYIHLETEPRINDPKLFEPIPEVRSRTYGYLARMVEHACTAKVLPNGIVVAHYEVFCHLVLEIFGIVATRETELRHVEPIELAFYEMARGTFYITARFRDLDRAVVFNLEDRMFTPV
jgi:broad specificity phosphatase PhoE